MFLNGTMNSLLHSHVDFLSFLASLGLSNHLETFSSPSEVEVHGWRFQQGLTPFRRHMVFTDVDPGSWDTIMNTASQILVENTGQVMMDFCWGRWVAEIGFTRQDIGFTHPGLKRIMFGFKGFREEKVRFWCAAKSWEFKIGNLVP